MTKHVPKMERLDLFKLGKALRTPQANKKYIRKAMRYYPLILKCDKRFAERLKARNDEIKTRKKKKNPNKYSHHKYATFKEYIHKELNMTYKQYKESILRKSVTSPNIEVVRTSHSHGVVC